MLKIRQDKQVIKKAVYLALSVNMDGQKELLGLWLSENEGAKFWLNVLTELQNRGVKDILIACVDGLKGFPDALAAAFPDTQIQLCIVHMVRNPIKFVSWKDYKAVTTDLKRIYQSVTEEEALLALHAGTTNTRRSTAHGARIGTTFARSSNIPKISEKPFIRPMPSNRLTALSGRRSKNASYFQPITPPKKSFF